MYFIRVMVRFRVWGKVRVNLRTGYRARIQGCREFFEAQGSVIEASRRGRKHRNLKELNLEALLEHCRLLLLGGSLNVFKEVINENFDIS